MLPIRIGTRPSRLAMKQAEMVSSLLNSKGFETTVVPVRSSGDMDNKTPLYESKGTGIFVEEINRAILNGGADIAVHSAKDLPSILPEGLEVTAVLPREDPSDVLISDKPLMDIPPGSVIGTSSMRRIRELLMVRGDLKTENIRGNLDTRIKKQAQGDFHGIVVAKAGIKRLSLDVGFHELNVDDFLPAPNQGIIAVVTRTNSGLDKQMAAINDEETMAIFNIERYIVKSLNLGCSMPVGLICTRSNERYNIKCRFYSSYMREYKEFKTSFTDMNALDELVTNIKEKVPQSYGYSFN